MQMRFNLLTLILILSANQLVMAKHIVGGGITYECKGGGIYEFTMKLYRDPIGGGAGFDNPASIAVYRCGNTTPCPTLKRSDAIQVLNVNVTQVATIQNPTYPCLIVPPNIRVEVGIYKFTLNLPASTENYFIVYQRCCRNNTINNIYDPEDTGASFSVEITPLAQQLCNDSPVFNSFPPTVICAGEPLNYAHTAVDPDGDQLVYEFCAPLNGGGPILQGSGTTGCEGVIPTPPCPPPFEPVNYILPIYSPTAPLAGNPIVAINPQTGIITGVPEIEGQFVVGVCVYEYRNGQLLSIIRRDFQFNVTPCEATVVADVKKDGVVGAKSYLINSCGKNTIQFIDQSYQPQNIAGHLWSFDVNGGLIQSTEKNPTITFPGPGQYKGQLVVNPNTVCSDSATIFVNVFPSINADFTFDYDTCVAGDVAFTDLSTTGSGQMVKWAWNFEPGKTSDKPDPSHKYKTPGVKTVKLLVEDINTCRDSITKDITWYPVPPLLIIEPSTFLGCEPAEIFFNNLSTPIDTTYTIIWDFGDGGTSRDISPTHVYAAPGTYSVSLELTSPIGCKTSASFNSWIVVEPSPEAAFSYDPSDPSSFRPTIRFKDASTGANAWLWQFDNNGISKLKDPVFTFPDTGIQVVTLTVTHPSGCQDTAMALIDIVPEVRYFMPNAFTPNRDGLNDLFIGQGVFDGITRFQLQVYNRWGELVFETTDALKGWDGTYSGRGDLAPPGVYSYVVTYVDSRGKETTLRGYATLVL